MSNFTYMSVEELFPGGKAHVWKDCYGRTAEELRIIQSTPGFFNPKYIGAFSPMTDQVHSYEQRPEHYAYRPDKCLSELACDIDGVDPEEIKKALKERYNGK